MIRQCPRCLKVFESGDKYCSARCARETHRQWRQALLGVVLGAAVLALAIYTAPKTEFRPEPRLPLSSAEIRQLAHDESCPICAGKTKVDCKVCIDGKFFFMGTSAACSRCAGNGWLTCPVCKGSGKLKDALEIAASS